MAVRTEIAICKIVFQVFAFIMFLVIIDYFVGGAPARSDLMLNVDLVGDALASARR